VNLVVQRLQESCASGFSTITSYVIYRASGFYPAGSDKLINDAKTFLISGGFFKPADFEGVTVRWCSLTSGTNGMTPDRDYVCLSDDYLKTNNGLETLVTLAHEMIHVRQIRSGPTDKFKCDYSRQFIACGGCQDDGNSFEHEAYEFERKARPQLTNLYKMGLPGRIVYPSQPSKVVIPSQPSKSITPSAPLPNYIGNKSSARTPLPNFH
jgi:hypothetical protein